MVTKLKYGNTNTFFISGTNGNLLIDTDYAGTIALFYKAIKEKNIKVSDITYILATHYHPDHIGLVSELMEKGVKLLIIDKQLPFIHFSDEIFKKDKILNYKPINEDKSVIININESRKFLKNLGINGTIVNTKSHSEDGIALILDDGEIFVGDLEPKEYLNSYEENKKLKNDWDIIMAYNPKIINYAHINQKIL